MMRSEYDAGYDVTSAEQVCRCCDSELGTGMCRQCAEEQQADHARIEAAVSAVRDAAMAVHQAEYGGGHLLLARARLRACASLLLSASGASR